MIDVLELLKVIKANYRINNMKVRENIMDLTVNTDYQVLISTSQVTINSPNGIGIDFAFSNKEAIKILEALIHG